MVKVNSEEFFVWKIMGGVGVRAKWKMFELEWWIDSGNVKGSVEMYIIRGI